MKMNYKHIAKAIQKIEKKNEKVTLKGIADLTGYTYQQLYCNGYKHLVKPYSQVVEKSVRQAVKPTAAPTIEELNIYKERSSEGSWVKITETCAHCGKVERTLFWETNSPSEFKRQWHASSPRLSKCHKVRVVEKFNEGDDVKAEVNKLSTKDRARYALSIKF